jgi:hypothetical protein
LWNVREADGLIELVYTKGRPLEPETIAAALTDASGLHSERIRGLLIDYRGVPVSPRMDMAALQGLVVMVERSRSPLKALPRVALVVDPILNSHSAKVYDELSRVVPLRQRLFRDLDEARRWLLA